MRRAVLNGPLGRLVLTEKAGALAGLRFAGKGDDAGARDAGTDDPSELLAEARRQLDAYFAGDLRRFDLPLSPTSGLQAALRDALFAIPFGETRTYGDLARALEVPAQAVGQACGANPVPIVVPCHRVLAANGLGGYSGGGGVETKVALLRHEGAAGLLI